LILPRWSRAALYGTTTDMWLFQNAASLERSFNAFQAEAARPLGGGGVTPLEQLDEPKLSGVVAGPEQSNFVPTEACPDFGDSQQSLSSDRLCDSTP